MEKGKDRASKLYFSDLGRAKEIITLALRRLGIEAGLSEIAIEDPVVSFLDTKISMEKLLDKLYKVKLIGREYNYVLPHRTGEPIQIRRTYAHKGWHHFSSSI